MDHQGYLQGGTRILSAFVRKHVENLEFSKRRRSAKKKRDRCPNALAFQRIHRKNESIMIGCMPAASNMDQVCEGETTAREKTTTYLFPNKKKVQIGILQ